jgi:hypothetical protein
MASLIQVVSGRSRMPVAVYPSQVLVFSGLWHQVQVFFDLWLQGRQASVVGPDPEQGAVERYAVQQEFLW